MVLQTPAIFIILLLFLPIVKLLLIPHYLPQQSTIECHWNTTIVQSVKKARGYSNHHSTSTTARVLLIQLHLWYSRFPMKDLSRDELREAVQQLKPPGTTGLIADTIWGWEMADTATLEAQEFDGLVDLFQKLILQVRFWGSWRKV